MMSTLSQSVEYDFETGLAKIRARGELDILGASSLRAATLKWLTDEPLAVIIDLTRVIVTDRVPLLVLPTLARRTDGPPVLFLLRPGSVSGESIRDYLARKIPLCESEPTAVELARRGASSSRLRIHLGCDASAPQQARALVAKACADWGLQHLLPAAMLIISELVTNSVQHSRSDLEVTVSHGGYYLHLNVRDRSHRLPRLYSFDSPLPEHSRGMKLVDGLASSWGTRLRPYGKCVWATLPIKPG
jgi:hypothetical protein